MRAFHAAFLQDSLWISLATFALAAIVYFWLPLNDGLKTALLFGCLSAPASALIRMNASAANSIRRYALVLCSGFSLSPWTVSWPICCWPGHVALHLSVVQVLWAFVIMNTIVAVAQAWLIGRRRRVCRASNGPARHALAPVLRGRAAALVIVGAVAASFADIVTLIAGFFLEPRGRGPRWRRHQAGGIGRFHYPGNPAVHSS